LERRRSGIEDVAASRAFLDAATLPTSEQSSDRPFIELWEGHGWPHQLPHVHPIRRYKVWRRTVEWKILPIEQILAKPIGVLGTLGSISFPHFVAACRLLGTLEGLRSRRVVLRREDVEVLFGWDQGLIYLVHSNQSWMRLRIRVKAVEWRKVVAKGTKGIAHVGVGRKRHLRVENI